MREDEVLKEVTSLDERINPLYLEVRTSHSDVTEASKEEIGENPTTSKSD